MSIHLQPRSARDLLDLLEEPVLAAAVGAALEIGLFWLLEQGPVDEEDLARILEMPPLRCRHLLEVISQTSLLERADGGYGLSAAGRRVVIDAYSQPTWALLAQEARERREALAGLPGLLRSRATPRTTDTYVSRMELDQERARRFTRMLFELHRRLGAEIAQVLDLDGVRRLLDLGGGSGVISMALVRRWPDLLTTVVDIANVCAAGRELCVGEGLADRIDYRPADLEHDDLPPGNDAVLACDLGLFSVPLFGRMRAALVEGGRCIIVDEFVAPAASPDRRLCWALERSLRDPTYAPPTSSDVTRMLAAAGFRGITVRPLVAAGPERVPAHRPAFGTARDPAADDRGLPGRPEHSPFAGLEDDIPIAEEFSAAMSVVEAFR